MTVCVAVLCENGSQVIGASDRMVSNNDNQIQRLKVHHLTDYVVVMIAGDVALHAELLVEVRNLINLNAENLGVLTVKNLTRPSMPARTLKQKGGVLSGRCYPRLA